MELDPKDARRRLQASPCEFAIRIARVEEHSNGGRRGNYLVQQLQPFRRYLYVQLRRARDIAAWPAQGADEAELHRICRGREDDGYRGDCRFGGERSRGTGRRDYLHLAMNQIGYQCRQSVVLPLRPPPFDRYVAALNVTGFAQPLAKCGDGPRVATLGPTGVDEPDHRQRRLLRARRERPRRRASEQRDELPPLHSITSSARSRIAVGNTIPSLFAVLRLMTSSNFVGNSAGTSPGFEPRNTFATIVAP